VGSSWVIVPLVVSGREWSLARRGWSCHCRRLVVGSSWVVVRLVVSGRATVLRSVEVMRTHDEPTIAHDHSRLVARPSRLVARPSQDYLRPPTISHDRIDRSQDFKHTAEPPCNQKWWYDNPKNRATVGEWAQDLSTIFCDLKRIELVSCRNLSYPIV
jgi:hypothetical protein